MQLLGHQHQGQYTWYKGDRMQMNSMNAVASVCFTWLQPAAQMPSAMEHNLSRVGHSDVVKVQNGNV